tara:strand:+ start:303 stop:461 length:159 start_codon:yes stop_codon:yes gene_type:complete
LLSHIEITLRVDAQRLEQYFTAGQSRCHFFRQLKERWQIGQILVGSSDFFIT